ncbi:MAG: ATP-binding protein [Terracidiphilus sp.]
MNQTELIESQHSEPAPFSAASTTFAPYHDQRSGPESDSVAALAHDARNLITALGLYCELLDEPGVLAPPFAHYRNELCLVTAAGRRLVSKLVAQSELDGGARTAVQPAPPTAPWSITAKVDDLGGSLPSATARLIRLRPAHANFDDEFASTPITNMAAELLANRNLLAALAGPGIAVTVDAERGARGIQLTAEDLTRILVNLVRNAADAMPSGGRIHISLTEIGQNGIGQNGISQAGIGRSGQSMTAEAQPRLLLAFEDNGTGIPSEIIGKVFDRGFTTQAPVHPGENWSTFHRGLGLAITRSIIESIGGRIEVSNRPGGGACFQIELPAI